VPVREKFRLHPGPVSVVSGVIVAIGLFFLGGSGKLDAVNVGLAALLGLAFGGAMYVTSRVRRPQ
jgi:hypothetical protein